MALPSYYKTGTASVTVGATAVTGQNTFWKGSVSPGDQFGTHRGLSIRIASVDSDTSLTLSHPWPHISQTAGGYEIQIVADPAAAMATTRELLKRLDAGLWLNPGATGTLAQRAAYNAEKQGFIYMRTDVVPFQVSVKTADTSGAWSGWTSLVGPKGGDGKDGVSPPGTFYDVAFDASGRPAASEEFEVLFARAVAFPVGLAGSRALVKVAPTGSAAVFSIRKNDVQFGTITFAVGSKVGVFAGNATIFAAGDTLTLRAPAIRNAALSDILVTLSGNRI
ncbi:hypothetical protein [Mycoplana ramosa]|uniref:Tail fiber protein n=1 Tax=Mycoplana ramosa TaxID=40837 RepID=A0ABW3Z1Z4_MYCRA